MFYEIYRDLCLSSGVSPNNVAKELSIASGAVTGWKNGRVPQPATLRKIADYFDVPIDYLLGKTHQPKSSDNSAFKELFIRLCNEKGVTPSKACRDVNIAPATFSCWDENSVPRQATLFRIADYFGVTVNYLLGKEHEKMFWENFLRLCNGKEISPNALAVALKIPSGSITNWKNGMVPRQATLLRIADYFGVTVDYLLGKEQEKKPSETEDLEEIRVALFGGDTEVTPEMWEEVKRFARYVAAQKKQEKK